MREVTKVRVFVVLDDDQPEESIESASMLDTEISTMVKRIRSYMRDCKTRRQQEAERLEKQRADLQEQIRRRVRP